MTDLAELAVAAITDLHHPVKIETAEWAAKDLHDPNLGERDLACEFWSEGWQRAADRGLLAAWVDPAHGGGGHDVITSLLMYEGLGYGCGDTGLAFALSTQTWTMQPVIEQFGSDEQKARYLHRLVDGTIKGAFCITEAESGSDTFAMATRFEEQAGDGDTRYVLSGSKAYVTMGPEADVFIVFATKDQSMGKWGVSAFLVDADTPGLEPGPNRPKMGLRTTPFCDVQFNDVEVGADAVLGSIGSGAAIFSHAMEAERAFVLAAQIGAMERQLDQTVRYSRERQQFGHAIGDFQAVSHRLANMKLRHDNSRLQLYRSAMLFALGKPSMEAAALAKIQASESAVDSSMDALLTHGARGYISEYEIERDLRNVAGGVVYGGTSDVQRNIVARMLRR